MLEEIVEKLEELGYKVVYYETVQEYGGLISKGRVENGDKYTYFAYKGLESISLPSSKKFLIESIIRRCKEQLGEVRAGG